MSANVVELPAAAAGEAERYLGPVTVRAAGRRRIDIELTSGEVVEAELALAFPYAPARGDTLLAIGERDRYWIMGVIEGRGTTKMAFQGDVEVRAAGGRLELVGDDGVRLRSPSFDVVTERFTLFARDAVEKLSTLRQHVRELLTVHAREAQALVEQTALHRARKHAVVAEETASVNGKQILLG